MIEPLNPKIIGRRHRKPRVKPYVVYNLCNLNRTEANRDVYVRLQLSTTPMQQCIKFPFHLGVFSGKITNKQLYEELIAALQYEVSKMP